MSATSTTRSRILHGRASRVRSQSPTAYSSTLLLAFLRIMFILGLLALLVFGAVMAVYGYFQITGRIVPGVAIRDVPIAGLTLAEAAAEIDAHLNQPTTTYLVDSRDETRTWRTSPEDLGLAYDAWESARQAFALGRKQSILTSVIETGYTYSHGLRLEPLPALDKQKAQQALREWATEIEVPCVEGTVKIDGDQVVAQPGKEGIRLQVQDTLSLLERAQLTVLDFGVLPVITSPTYPAISDVSQWQQEAQDWIARDLHLTAYDPVLDTTLIWAPEPQEMAEWVRIHRRETEFAIDFDKDAARKALEGWAAQLGDQRALDLDQAFEDALQGMHSGEHSVSIIHYKPTEEQVNPYQSLPSLGAQIGMPYWKILEYNEEITGSGAIGRSTITIPPPDAMLELPVIVGKRIKISIAEQHLWVYEDGEQIADFTISTGMNSSPTLPGLFQIKSHYINAYASNWDLWMPHFMGIYDAVPGFENGIHGLPVLANGVRLWANVLGRPASYGCIILDLESAEWLYEWAEEGVVVEILRDSPDG